VTAPLEPTWTFPWSGHPSGFPRTVLVFFRDGSAPADDVGVAWARELATLGEEATNEQLFHHAVLTFAERHRLNVVQVVFGSDHRYPAGDVVTVTFEATRPMTFDVTD
jgi:hypothetical protein